MWTYPLARKGAYATASVTGAIWDCNLLHRKVLTSHYHQRMAQAPTIAAFRPLSWRLPRRPACGAPTQVSSISTSPCKGLPPHVHHRAPQFVQQQPRRFVPPPPHLPLKQEGRDAPLVGDCQIGRPEPHGERRLRVVENRPGGQRYLIPTRRTLPAPLLDQSIAARMPAPGTRKTVRPATRRQVVLASLFGGELALKLAAILRSEC